ncbi:hypothetical protein FRC09_002287 [Ceratobasidium sp. 395]|nr:hypothetical protein FRC09_002287 [Ceratobasidium sp. 395]
MTQNSVFATNELLIMILAYLSIPECARVLTVNSAFFRHGADRVWRELSSPAPLFALFCELRILVTRDGYKLFELSVPEEICPGRWKRSRVYADRVCKVTNLRVYGGQESVLWSDFDRVLSRAPVADHVQEVEVHWGHKTPNAGNLVRSLLGPDTSTLACYGSCEKKLTADEARSLLERAQAVGSNLTNLDLWTDQPGDDKAVMALALQIRRFEQLVSIRFSTELVTGSMLNAIRGLPLLQNLSFGLPHERDGVSLWGYLSNEDNWTGQPFSSLRSLVIFKSRGPAILRFLSTRPSLLHGLKTLRFHMTADGDRFECDAAAFPALAVLIASRAPGLEDLSISFPDSRSPWVLQPPLLACLFSLNLRKLVLNTVQLPTDSPGLALIDGKWPSLSRFVMPFQPAWPTDLRRLAKREALRSLVVDVKAPRQGEEISTSGTEVESSAVPMRLKGRFEIQDTGEDATEKMAR